MRTALLIIAAEINAIWKFLGGVPGGMNFFAWVGVVSIISVCMANDFLDLIAAFRQFRDHEDKS